MISKIQNEYGAVLVDNEVIARTAGVAAMECYGIVGMAARNMRDGLVQILKMESLTKGVRLNLQDNCLSIDLHVIVEYGTNITAITETLMSNVKYKVEDTIGITVNEVNIFVESVRVH
ncbi:MAG: Asp23/Gls24 family envelope stress response protein [Clostridiales bacterium]|nr:Asp23/Gls24 family envelope stress response protein [Clostridiales bacterium]